ncbi:phosphotransferase [Rhodovibrionaceae bacterium A322]
MTQQGEQASAEKAFGRNDITAEWIAGILNQPPGPITVTALGEDSGFSGELARVSLTSGPTDSLVVKLPSQDPQIRQMMSQMGFYQREKLFLEQLADGSPLTIPQLLASGGDDAAPILLLEDLKDGCPGDQLRGMAPKKASFIVKDLAAFHAHFWQRPDGKALPDWLPRLDQGPDIAAFYQACWPAFEKTFGEQLPDWLHHLAPTAGTALTKLRSDLSQEPATVLHGDLRLDNLLFFADGGWALLDWQTVIKGRGGFDLAYLSAGNFLHHRPEALTGLLAAYHDSLTAAGVDNYSLETVTQDYRKGIAFLWARTVISGAKLGFDSGPAFERFSLALARWCDAAEEAEIKDLLKN